MRGPLSLPHADQLPGTRLAERIDGSSHEGREIREAVAFRLQQHDRQVEAGEVLLVRDALIRSYESIELVLGEFE